MKVAVLSVLEFSIVSFVGLCRGQDNPCEVAAVQVSCDVCISTSYLCSWCPYAPNDIFRRINPRCNLADGRVCVGNVTMEHPQPSMDVVKDEPLSTEPSAESIQVSPQNITLNLRAKMAEKFNMTFVSLRNSSLDIYILLDLSSPGYSFQITPIEGCDTLSANQSCNLQFDERVTFEVSVTLENCSKARPIGVQLCSPPFSFTFVNLNPICECKCSKQNSELSSDFCSTRGSLQCGQCDCGVKYFGESCECNTTIHECKVANVGGYFITCSGLGVCTTCGECQCFNNTFGEACECNERSCPGNCNGKGSCQCEASPRCLCDIDPVSKFRYFNRIVGDIGSCRCNPVDCFNHQYPGELCHNVIQNTNGAEYCYCISGMAEPRVTCVCPGGSVPFNNTCVPEDLFCSVQELCARCAIEEIANSSCDNCRISRFRELVNNTEAPVGFNLECAYPAGSCTNRFSFMQEDTLGDVYYNRQCSVSTRQGLPPRNSAARQPPENLSYFFYLATILLHSKLIITTLITF